MDNLTQRRIIGITGIIIATMGIIAFVWGIFNRDSVFQAIGFFSIIIAWVLTVVVKKIREKGEAEKAAAALEKESKIE